MRLRPWLPLLPLLLLAGCEPGTSWLSEGLARASVRSFQEVSAAEARGWIANGAVLVEHDPWREDALLRGPEPSVPVIVVSGDRESGLRLAARLAREGARVGLVREGLARWRSTSHAGATPERRGS